MRRHRRTRLPALFLVGIAACAEYATTWPDPAGLRLSAESLSFSSLGETQQLAATATDQGGAVVSGASITWTSSAPAVASVSSPGLVTAHAEGEAVITAAWESHVDSAVVVVQQVPATLMLEPEAVVLGGPGDTATVAVSVRDAGGSAMAGATFAWTSNDEGVATVDADGLVTGVTHGSTTASVSSDVGLDQTLTVTVADGVLAGPEGGQISLAGGMVRLTIPPGALHESLYVTAAPATNLPPAPVVIPGTAFDLGPDGLTFAQPVTKTVGYDPGHVPVGVPEEELHLHELLDGSWVPLPSGSVDVGSREVSGSIVGFSVYAALHRLEIRTTSLPPGQTGTTYSQTLTATGGDGSYVWTLEAGQLPAGLLLSPSGVISGTPTTLGTSSFTLRVTNGTALSTTAELSIDVSGDPPPPAPTLALSAEPASIDAGDSASLAWSSTEAITCTASVGWSGTRALSGSESVSPAVTTTYRLTCDGPGGSVSRSATVAVDAPPVAPAVSISATPVSIGVGDASTLTWSSTDATACTASDGWSGPRALNGFQSVSPTATTTYALTCDGPGGSAGASATVTVSSAQADVAVAKTGPASVDAGEQLTYTLTVTNGGPSTATGVVLTDVLPAGVTFVSASDGGVESAGTVKWPAVALSDGESVQRTVTVNAPASGTLDNVASATATTPDPDPSNNDGTNADAQVATTVVAPPSGGLVSHWTFSEGSGTTANDAVGSNTGTLVNGPLRGPGRVGDGLLLDGVDDYVGVADDATLDITGELTVAAWIKPGSLGQNDQGRIMDKASEDGTVGFVFRMSSSNRLGFQQHGQTAGVASPAGVVELGTWQHVAAVVSGGTDVTFYVDGQSVGGGTLTGAIGANAKPIRIGMRHDGNRMFDGRIDEVRIYDDALTPSEIAALYDEEAANPLPTQAPTVVLSASPTAIVVGELSTLTWSSTDAATCTASEGWSGARGTSGSQSVSPAATTTYTLTCDGPGGSASESVTVTVSSTYYPPPEASGGWRSLVTRNATPSASQKADIVAYAGLDWDQLKVARDYSEATAPSNVLVIRNGWIAGEWGSSASEHVASVTKSLTGLALAKLMDMSDAGQVAQSIGLGSLAHEYLPAEFGDSDPLKQQIRIEHLMTMSAGIEPEDPDNLTELERLTQPMDAAPEAEWVYSSLPPNLLSMILEGVAGQSLAGFFNTRIASEIGAAPLSWQTIDGGYTRGAAGAETTARDLARIAYLTLRDGAWDDGSGPTQVVSAARVATLTSPAALTAGITFREAPGSPFPVPTDAPNHYGHLWWTNSTQVALGASVPTDAYYMHGCLDDLAIVVPSENLVVVRTASSGDCSDPTFRSELMQRVMAAIVD